MVAKSKILRKKRLFSADFRCKCGHKWTVNKLHIQESRECPKCQRKDCWPLEVHLLSPIDTNNNTFTAVTDNRYFGQYQCFRCLRTWFSAHSWLGFGQQCINCKIATDAHKLRQLQRPRGMDKRGDPFKQHESSLCSKCKELGGNCNKTGKKKNY